MPWESPPTDRISRLLHGKNVELSAARSAVAAAAEEVSRLAGEAAAWSEAAVILQDVARRVQQNAHARIAGVVTRCLAAVFDDPYEFHIEFQSKRGRTEAEMYFTRDGRRLSPKFAAGGGVLDVAAFALRLACLMLTKPPLRRVLVLDEPFKGVNGDRNRERLRSLVETLPGEMGVQVILATGLDWLKCGKIVEVSR